MQVSMPIKKLLSTVQYLSQESEGIMTNEPELGFSPSSQLISSGGRTVNIQIYRLEGEIEWDLEVEDEFGNSTVWDDKFSSDSSALVEVKKTILAEGISSLVGPKDGKGNSEWR